VTRLAAPIRHAAEHATAAAFATLNPDWTVIGTDARQPTQHERIRRWERNRLLGRRAQEALAEENDGSTARRRQAVEERARSALVRRRQPGPHTAPAPPPSGGRVRCCPWQRCNRPATDLVTFAPPHPLAGKQHRYCTAHAAEAASAPGASLTADRPAQLTFPGIGEPARP
jgi:hypothetical protein